MQQGKFREIAEAVKFLKRKRRNKKISLAILSEMMGTSSTALSRLEGFGVEGRTQSCPDYKTIKRYAKAIGYRVSIKIELNEND